MISENKDFIKALTRLIACKSKQSKAEEGAPFGTEVRKALDFVLNLSSKMGLYTVNYDGYFGEAFFGEGEEFGIIGHLDVVPEGKGWDTPPFELALKDGVYYGRGITDDKAPMLMCLFAIKKLMDEGVQFNRKIRLLFGCNEESGWGCVDYFLTKSKFPKQGFSPDSDFPVVYAEKGINLLTVTVPYENGKFVGIKGGNVSNAVPNYAELTGPINVDRAAKIRLKTVDGKLIAEGKAAHASRPEEGINAIEKIVKYMVEEGEPVKRAYDVLFADSLKIKKLKNDVGAVTLSPDLIEQTPNSITITCDLRIPYGYTVKHVTDIFDKSGLVYEIKKMRDPLYVDKSGKLAKTLLSAYNSVTGESAKPIALGGVTFASLFEEGMAFGPEFPGMQFCIHEPNERMSVKAMDAAFEIYYNAIKEIVKG